MTFLPILAVFYFTTIFFGGDFNWVCSIAEIFIFLFSVFFLSRLIIRSKTAWIHFKFFIKDPVTLFGISFLTLLAIQLFPCPPGLINILSPMSFQVWKSAPLPDGGFFSISVYPYATKHGLIFILCLLLVYWWALFGLRDQREIEKTVLGMVVFGALVAFYGLFEGTTGHDQILWWKKTLGQGTVTATFFNRNHLATFVSMTLLIGIGYFWYLWISTDKRGEPTELNHSGRTEDRIKRLGVKGLSVFLSLLILVFTLLATASRGGNLSALAGLMCMAWLITCRFAQKKKAAAFFLLIVVIIAFAAYRGGSGLWERLKWDSLEQIQSSPGLNRSSLNKDTRSIVRDYPLLGAGFNTFPFVFTRYAEHSINYIDHAHNDWLEIAAETGLVGSLIILCGLLITAYYLFKTARDDPDPLAAGMTIGGLGVLLAVSLHGLTDFSLHKPANAILLASILGITFRTVYHREKLFLKDQVSSSSNPDIIERKGSGVKEGDRGSTASHGVKGRLKGGLVLLMGVSLCVWGIDAALRSFILNRLIPAELEVTGQRPEPDLEEAITAVNVDPDNSAGWAWLSQALQNEKKALPDIQQKKLQEKARSRWAKEIPVVSSAAYQLLFPVFESLARRPVSPHYWYQLILESRAVFKENPSFFVPLITRAFDQVLFYNPRLAIGFLDRGLFCLQTERSPSEKSREGCFNDLKKSLELEPGLVSKLIEELAEQSISMGKLTEILPENKAEAWISAGQILLQRNQWILGEMVYLKGELLKIKETDALSFRIKKGLQEGRAAQIEYLIEELRLIDPDHPWVWYIRGYLLKALESASQRGWSFQDLDEISRLRASLNRFTPRSETDQFLTSFYLARLELEQKRFKEAARELDLVLKKQPNYYPALLARGQMLTRETKNEEEKILLGKIQKKTALFSMEEISAGAWVENGSSDEAEVKTYRAVLRNDRPLKEINLTTPATAEGWMLFIENRFTAARKIQGSTFKIDLPAALFPGEHQIFLKPVTPTQASQMRTFSGRGQTK
jgi:O-antigen ligase